MRATRFCLLVLVALAFAGPDHVGQVRDTWP